jgi:hypothetical protein
MNVEATVLNRRFSEGIRTNRANEKLPLLLIYKLHHPKLKDNRRSSRNPALLRRWSHLRTNPLNAADEVMTMHRLSNPTEEPPGQ